MSGLLNACSLVSNPLDRFFPGTKKTVDRFFRVNTSIRMNCSAPIAAHFTVSPATAVCIRSRATTHKRHRAGIALPGCGGPRLEIWCFSSSRGRRGYKAERTHCQNTEQVAHHDAGAFQTTRRRNRCRKQCDQRKSPSKGENESKNSKFRVEFCRAFSPCSTKSLFKKPKHGAVYLEFTQIQVWRASGARGGYPTESH